MVDLRPDLEHHLKVLKVPEKEKEIKVRKNKIHVFDDTIKWGDDRGVDFMPIKEVKYFNHKYAKSVYETCGLDQGNGFTTDGTYLYQHFKNKGLIKIKIEEE